MTSMQVSLPVAAPIIVQPPASTPEISHQRLVNLARLCIRNSHRRLALVAANPSIDSVAQTVIVRVAVTPRLSDYEELAARGIFLIG